MGQRSGRGWVTAVVVVVVVGAVFVAARTLGGDPGGDPGAGCGTEPSVAVVSDSSEPLVAAPGATPLVEFRVEMEVTNDTPVPVHVAGAQTYALNSEDVVAGSTSETLEPGEALTVEGTTVIEPFGGMMPVPDLDRLEAFWSFADPDDGVGCGT